MKLILIPTLVLGLALFAHADSTPGAYNPEVEFFPVQVHALPSNPHGRVWSWIYGYFASRGYVPALLDVPQVINSTAEALGAQQHAATISVAQKQGDYILWIPVVRLDKSKHDISSLTSVPKILYTDAKNNANTHYQVTFK